MIERPFQPGRPPSARSFLSSRATHPLALDVLLSEAIGADYYTWDPLALWIELTRRTGVPNISSNVKQKAMACCLVKGSSRAFDTWQALEKVVAAFNDQEADFSVMQKPELAHLVVGVSIMRGLRDWPFSDETQRYMAAALLTDEVVYAPAPISFINHELLHHSPLRLHEEVTEIATSPGWLNGDSQPPGVSEAAAAQLAKLRAAQVYSAEFNRRLLESLRVVDHVIANELRP